LLIHWIKLEVNYFFLFIMIFCSVIMAVLLSTPIFWALYYVKGSVVACGHMSGVQPPVIYIADPFP
jgi:hypothetical protein